MNALVLSDKEFRTEAYDQIRGRVLEHLNSQGLTAEEIAIGREDLDFCMGCFGCWIKSPGECVIRDMVADINRKYVGSDVVVYLCPVVFGQFSANMKNALDRWIPNILPFFKRRPDGSTIHPTRYDNNPRQIMIAYAEDLQQEDGKLFTDIIMKHRNAVDVIIYNNSITDLSRELESIQLKKVGAVL